MSNYSYIIPATVRVLVVPTHGCTRGDFDRYMETIRAGASEVRLLDMTARPDLRYFNAQSFPQGRIKFEFVTTSPESESLFLHDFEPFRKEFVVLGLSKYCDTVPSDLIDLAKAHPTAIIHNSIVFDTPTDQIDRLSPPNDHSSKSLFYHTGPNCIQSLMCGVADNFLIALDNYASSYTNITLRSPVSISNTSQMLPRTIAKAQKRLSSSSFKNGSSTSISISSNGGGGIGVGGSGSGQSNNGGSLASIDKSKPSRQAGRQAKLMGNFYLLAGMYSDALHHFTEASIALKKCDDQLWLGSSLEGISVCTLLLSHLGINYQIPSTLLHSILQVPKNRLSISTGLNLHLPENDRHSSESSQTRRTSVYSPRNSTASSIANFHPSNSDNLDAFPVPEFIRFTSSKAFQCYHLSTNDFENMVPDLVYVDTLFRYIKFMVHVYLGGEFTPEVIDNIVNSTPQPPVKVGGTVTSTTSPVFSKQEILRELEKVFSLQLADLDTIQQCRVYCALASVYSDLGLERKRAFILRILLMGVLPQLEKNTQDLSNSISSVSSISFEDGSAESYGFRDILEDLFKVYGIALEPESSSSDANNNAETSWHTIQVPLLKLCLRLCEAVADWAYAIRICTVLLTRFTHCLSSEDQVEIKNKFDSISQFAKRNNLAISSPYWDPYLVRGVKFISSRATEELVPFTENMKGGEGLLAEKKSANTSSTKPFVFNPYDKTKRHESMDRDKLLIKDDTYHLKVTLQNPFAFEVEVNDVTIETEGEVQVETLKQLLRPVSSVVQTNFPVTPGTPGGRKKPLLSNSNTTKQRVPTAININANAISSIPQSLSSMYIAPNSSRQFVVPFKPQSVGELRIVGFKVSMCNCTSQLFQIIDEESVTNLSKIKVHNTTSETDTLTTLIDNLQDNKVDARTSTQSLTLYVIKPQPSLSLTSMSIDNGWLMLLQGEKYNFSIRLSNVSSEEINYLSFSFWDSTIDQLNARLSAATSLQLPASDVYELEWYLVKFKPFRITNKDEITDKYRTILPQDDLVIEYEITGKRGIRESKMILEYSNKDQETPLKSFVKFVHVPLQLTILPSMEMIAFDIFPLVETWVDELQNNGAQSQLEKLQSSHKSIAQVLEFFSREKQISDFCVLSVDLKNSWQETLWTHLEYKFEGFEYVISEKIEAGKAARFFIPVHRISDHDVEVTKRIPSLLNKQFVKNYSMSDDEEMSMRETFWLRETILERLSGDWSTSEKIDGSNRSGIIDLRALRLSSRMVKTLTKSTIHIKHEVYMENGGKMIKNSMIKDGSNYELQTEEFYTLRTIVCNESTREISGVLRHLPILSDLQHQPHHSGYIRPQLNIDRRVLVHGVLQKVINPIKPGETMVEDLSFTILERGQYEWGTILDADIQIVSREPVMITAA
ncbi:trafficking protein particle complex II-specific subunit 120 [[Candida] anglica]